MVGRVAPNPPREREAGGERLPVREVLASRIGHRKREPAPARRPEEPQVQQVSAPEAVRDGIGAQLLDCLSHLFGARRRRQGLAECYGHGIGDPRGPLPEEAAVLEAEDAAPDLVEVDG
jgi:hypothetical protein